MIIVSTWWKGLWKHTKKRKLFVENQIMIFTLVLKIAHSIWCLFQVSPTTRDYKSQSPLSCRLNRFFLFRLGTTIKATTRYQLIWTLWTTRFYELLFQRKREILLLTVCFGAHKSLSYLMPKWGMTGWAHSQVASQGLFACLRSPVISWSLVFYFAGVNPYLESTFYSFTSHRDLASEC